MFNLKQQNISSFFLHFVEKKKTKNYNSYYKNKEITLCPIKDIKYIYKKTTTTTYIYYVRYIKHKIETNKYEI